MGDYVAGKAWKQEKHQRILEAGFSLFSQRGIEQVTMPEVAQASGVSRMTLFRYFPSKTELVIAIGAWKWEDFISWYGVTVTPEKLAQMTGAEYIRFFLDSFLELYRHHSDMLRFQYNLNSFIHYEMQAPGEKRLYRQVADSFGARFHKMYQRGIDDGTLNADVPEQVMFSSAFHIMLAAVTRYAVGLVVVYEGVSDPESELLLLEESLMSRYCRGDAIETREDSKGGCSYE